MLFSQQPIRCDVRAQIQRAKRHGATKFSWLKPHIAIFALLLTTGGFSSAQPAAATGNGPYAAPLAAAYADLTNAANKIVAAGDLHAKVVVIYDQPTFATLASYPVTIDQLRLAMRGLCPAVPEAQLVPALDIGGALQGLTGLLNTLTPNYAIQGQAVTFDNTALIAALAHQIGSSVIFPAYLMPAATRNTLDCGNYSSSVSVADLWVAAVARAAVVAMNAASMPDSTDLQKAAKKAVQDKVDKFQKLADSFLATDKGPSALSKLLVAESLLRQVQGSSPVKVIDLKLDAAGVDSTTRTILWWKSTKFNCTVMAHYTLMNMSYDGHSIDLTPFATDGVDILSRLPDEGGFATSEYPLGQINGANPSRIAHR